MRDILEKYKEPCPEALVESALRNIGIIENGKLRVRTWRLPELIPERFEDRELEGSHEFIIAKEGVLDGQKLQASDDGSRM